MLPLHITLINTAAAHGMRCWTEFQKLDLTKGQPKVLSRLLICEGSFQKELADYCKVSPATMTVILYNMEKNGLIRKEKDTVSGGKRAYRIYLTELGTKKALAVDQIVWEIEDECYKGFTKDEKELLIQLLEKVTANL